MTKEARAALKENPEEYLGQYRKIKHEVERAIEQHEALRLKSVNMTQQLTFAPAFSSFPGSRVEECAVAMSELAEHIRSRAADLRKAKALVEEAIVLLDDRRDRRIMTDYYLNILSWADIADSQGLTYRRIMQLKKEILEKF